MTDVVDRRHELLVSAALVASITAAMGADVVADLQKGLPPSHFAIHVALIALVGAYAVHLVRLAARHRREASDLGRALDAARQEADRWRTEASEAIQGFGAAIDRQFERWQLSPAER